MRIIVLCALVGTLLACSDKAGVPVAEDTVDDRAELSSLTSDHSLDIDRTVQLPNSLVFSPSLVVRRAESWRDFSSMQVQSDRDILDQVSARYRGVVEFNSFEEQEMLARSGFPMPEEWIAAASMSVEELEQQASTGNVKAQMFYSDRLSSALSALQQSRTDGGVPDEVVVEQIIPQSARSLTVAANLMRSSSSPFSAYVYGRALSGASFGAPAEPIAGSYFAARDRGDTRANSLMQSFLNDHRSLNMQSVMATYSIMATLKPEGA